MANPHPVDHAPDDPVDPSDLRPPADRPVAPGHDDDALIRAAAGARGGHPMLWGLAAGAVVVLAVVLLVVQNTTSTDLHWLFIDVTAPLWVLTVVAFALGALSLLLGRTAVRVARERSAVRRSAVHALHHP